VVDEEPPGQGGDRAGQAEGRQAEANRVDAVRLGGRLVVAHRDEGPPEAAGAHAAQAEAHQHEYRERQVVGRGLGRHLETAQQRGALDAVDRHPPEPLVVQEERGGGQREGEGGHREVQAAQP
jgi:hypothetical protein